ASGVKIEETHDFVIVECQAGSSQAERVRREIHLPAQDSCLELGGSIAPISEAAETAFQIGEKENVGGRIARELLVEGQMCSPSAEIAELQHFEPALPDVKKVSAGFEAFDRIHNKIDVVQRRKVRGNAARGVIQDRR